MEALAKQLKHAWRMALRNPGYSAVIILALGLGIGASSAVVGALYDELVRPPLPGADRVVFAWQTTPDEGASTVGPGNFLDWREQADALESWVAVRPYGFDLLGEEPEAVPAALVTEGFFGLWSTSPTLGRGLTA